MTNQTAKILVVDDDALNRILIVTNLEEQGYQVLEAENGQEALDKLRRSEFDLVLLDLLMPVMDGFETLRQIKADLNLRHLPVIVISALEEMDSVVRCIEMGATDHLPKPFDPLLLNARMNASLVSKRLRDLEQAYLQQIEVEQKRSERLLLNVLPGPIAERLKRGEQTIVESFQSVTVLFGDLVGFTRFVSQHSPPEMLNLLNTIFRTFDEIVERYGLEKIKTIGDAYMLAGGLPLPRAGHVQLMAQAALEMQEAMARLNEEGAIPPFQMRMGIHLGPVVAGVIGSQKFSYDLWGDTVNTASRVQAFSTGGRILVSAEVCAALGSAFRFEEHGPIQLKDLRQMQTYWLLGRS